MRDNNKYSHLWAIGCVRTHAGAYPYDISWRDMEADIRWTQRILLDIGVARDGFVHITHSNAELSQYWPYYACSQQIGAVCANGMPSPYDAYRLEMYLRRFNGAYAIGVSSETLDGLISGGWDIKAVFEKTSGIVALPGAWERLREASFLPWRLLKVGPVHALESPNCDGARFNNYEWEITEKHGELFVTSGRQRSCGYMDFATGIKGKIKKCHGKFGLEHRVFLDHTHG